MSEIKAEGTIKIPIDSETKEWLPGQDTSLPINGHDIPNFKAWVNWNGFHFDRETGMGHRGFDFAAYLTLNDKIILGLPSETPIRAVADGLVRQILDSPEAVGGGYGVTIHVEHGAKDSGMFSSYIHVIPSVEYGKEVKKGDVIGTLYKDPGLNEGRLVHLHLELMSGWGTRGSSVMGGGRDKRQDDPKIISQELYKFNAEPQGNSHFTVPSLKEMPVQIANFAKVRVNQ